MPLFEIILTRDTTESATVQIEAATEDEANEAALTSDPSGLTWAVDDGNIAQAPYVTGTEEIG